MNTFMTFIGIATAFVGAAQTELINERPYEERVAYVGENTEYKFDGTKVTIYFEDEDFETYNVKKNDVESYIVKTVRDENNIRWWQTTDVCSMSYSVSVTGIY